MKKYLLIIVVFLQGFIIFSQSTSVFDANYFSSRKMDPPIKIGKGFHINDIFKQTLPCFSAESTEFDKLSPHETGINSFLKFYYTKNNEEFNIYKQNGTSGKVGFLNLFSVDGNISEILNENTTSIQERLILVLNVDFGIFSFKEKLNLKNEAQSLINEEKYQEFIDLYGTHYISGVRKGSTLEIIITKTYSNSNEENSFYNSIKMNGKVPFKVSSSFEIQNNNSVNEFLSSENLSIEINVSGPEINISYLQSQIENIINGDESDKSTALKKNLSGVDLNSLNNIDQSKSVQYYYSPFTLYGLNGIQWNQTKQNYLENINNTAVELYLLQNYIDIQFKNKDARQELIKDLKKYGVDVNLINSKFVANYNKVVPDLIKFKSTINENLQLLKQYYNSCSDIFCATDSNCCFSNQNILHIRDQIIQIKNKQNELNQLDREAINLIEIEIEKQPDCEKRNLSYITFINESSNPYYLYYENEYKTTIDGYSNETFEVVKGTYNFKAVQKSGYAFYATENYRTVNVNNICNTYEVRIGFED